MSAKLKPIWEPAVSEPDGLKRDYFVNADGRKLACAFAPAKDASRGNIILTTGFGDSHIFHYETIKRYQQMGFDVWTFDWAGQGLSEKVPDVKKFEPQNDIFAPHIRDLTDFVTSRVKSANPRPVIYASHSMGAHIGLRAMKANARLFNSSILVAPLIDFETHFMPRKMARSLVRFGIKIGLHNKSLPSLEQKLKEMAGFAANDNLAADGTESPNMRRRTLEGLRAIFKDAVTKRPSFGWTAAAFKSLDQMLVRGWFDDVQTPSLFISANHDEIVNNNAIFRAAKEMPNATHMHIFSADHDLFSARNLPYEAMWLAIRDHLSPYICGEPNPQNSCPTCPKL